MKKQNFDPLKEMVSRLDQYVQGATFEPTGLQEEMIYAVGCGDYNIIVALHANDVGKTALGVNILKNIILKPDAKWFSWWEGKSLFKEKSFPLKRFRITGTPTSLADNGAIRQEILKWWPANEYESDKAGKHYFSQYKFRNGWVGDCLSYEQSRTEFESVKTDIIWSDEPPPHALVGAMTSRFADNFLWIITATPLECGIFLDLLDDIEDASVRNNLAIKVKRLTGTAFDNSVKSGKANHLGTKRGLRSDESISRKVSVCPPDEYKPRIMGEGSHKSGKIYPEFDRMHHVLDFDMNSPMIKNCNAYMCIDPHIKYYPAIQWWLFMPDGIRYLYNEWPMYDDFNSYYDEIRTSKEFSMQIKTLCDIIKVLDMTEYGIKIEKRFVDPYFASGLGGGVTDKTLGVVKDFAQYGIMLSLPPKDKMQVAHNDIRRALHWECMQSKSNFNQPMIYMASHCRNSIRAIERTYWKEGKEVEAEDYKDYCDTARMFFAGVQSYVHKKEEPKTVKYVPVYQSIIDSMKDTSLV